jgi:site-specific recombinase XerD
MYVQPSCVPPMETAVTVAARKFGADVEQAIADFIRLDVAGGVPSSETVASYTSVVKQHLHWLAAMRLHPFTVTAHELKEYRAGLAKCGYSRGTIQKNLAVVRRFYAALHAQGRRPDNPAHGLKPPTVNKPTETIVKHLTEEQVAQLVAMLPRRRTLRDLRDRLIICLMLAHGLRVCEIQRMEISDLSFTTGHTAILVRGKCHNRVLWLRYDVHLLLRAYLDIRLPLGGTHLFLSLSHNRRSKYAGMSKTAIRNVVDAYLAAIGAKTLGVSCHALRHTAATLAYRYTKDIRGVQEMLGHRSPVTTARYAHLIEGYGYTPAAAVPIDFAGLAK